MARLKQIVVDARHPASLAKFWASLLDGFEIRPYDADEVARLASIGRTPDDDPCVILDGPGIELCFQEIEVRSSAKRPMHLDLQVDDRDVVTVQLVGLGATVVERFDAHTWLRDPEGNDFCLTDH